MRVKRRGALSGSIWSCSRVVASNRTARSASDKGVLIDLKLTHQHLADMTGTARETVTKSLLGLQDEQLIRIDQRKIHYDAAP